MEAGVKDRPPKLEPGNYVQWKSLIKRYIDTKPNIELIHYYLQNPPYKFEWAERTIPVAEGIDNDIYSIVDACPNACEMWKSIERLKQGESVNVQDLETNLYWEFRKFTSRDGETIESYCSMFYKMMNELSQELKTVSYHKLYDILKQHQNEVNEIRSERLAVQLIHLHLLLNNNQFIILKTIILTTLKIPQPDHNKLLLEIEKIYKPTNNNLRTSSNTSRANKDNTPRVKRGIRYDNQREINVAGARENVATKCQKPKRAKDAAYHKENMLLCKQEEAGFQLNAEQADWRDDNDDELEDQKLEAHYLYMVQIQEVTPDAANNSGPIFDVEPLQKVQIDDDNYNVFANDREHPEQSESINYTYPDEQGDTNITTDSLDMSDNGGEADEDDDDDYLARERDLLASLIEKLKCEIDESK
ncbi:hypothetical protein Tco_1155448 [Tanacetum coccineum]